MVRKRLTTGTAFLALVLTAGIWGSTAHAAVCSASTPQYCPVPVVATGLTTSVTSTSATLTGTVNPGGADTSCAFAYGTTTSYGSTTPLQSVGSGTSTVGVTGSISGLSPNTTYHYQLVCANAGKLGFGGDFAFTTAKKGASKVQIKTKVALVGKNGKVGFKVTCAGDSTCKGSISLTAGGGKAADTAAAKALAKSKKFTIGAHKTKTIFLKLKKKPLNGLKNSKSHKRKARVTVKTNDGSKATKIITLKLKK